VVLSALSILNSDSEKNRERFTLLKTMKRVLMMVYFDPDVRDPFPYRSGDPNELGE
jgi:hypothetical protein